MKRILLVNGNYNDIPLVEAAHRLGCYVITSGNDPKGEAHAFSDEYCPCDFSDKEAMLRLAKEKDIDAICSCGNDLGAITAAYVSEALNLPGHDSYAGSRLFHEKDEFKKMAKALNLPTPESHAFTELPHALAYISETTFPRIIKPVDLGGGKGVSVAYNGEEGRLAIEAAFQKSKIKHIVVEEYIEGSQHGFICYIKDQKVVFDYSTNDYSYRNPFMVWMGSGYPADGYETVRERIIDDVEKMASTHHIADGFLTIQYMMKNGQPYYIETMRRCLGNLHFKCLSRDLGIDMYELFIATEMGNDCSGYLNAIKKTGCYSGFMGLYAERNGRIRDICLDEEFEKMIFDRWVFKEPGFEVSDYLNEKLGMVWFSFNSEEQRRAFLARRESLFRVVMEDE